MTPSDKPTAERYLPLDELKTIKSLAGMELLRKGSRLSVQPVEPAAFKAIVKLLQSIAQKKKS